MPGPTDTQEAEYTRRLTTLSGAKWKQVLDVQRPYRWNLRRLEPGRTLDLGCGIGRQLVNLPAGSVGVDHNAHSIREATAAGLTAFTPEEFKASQHAGQGSYDSILLGHVFEHMTPEQDAALLGEYVGYLRSGGKVIVLCPQERGYTTDASHVTFMDVEKIVGVFRAVGVNPQKAYSFPFPRRAGRWFTYNEFVVVGRKP